MSWMHFIKERFSVPGTSLLVGGMSASIVVLHGSYSLQHFVAIFCGQLFIFMLLRLMDEVKDYKKDLIAHPTRPLPRGLVEVDTVKKTIRRGLGGGFIYAVAMSILIRPEAGSAYFVCILYLYLMYKEFFMNTWLGKRPILYAISHQALMLPLVLFGAVVAAPSLAYKARTLWLGFLFLGAFFSYEVARKLDPAAHPILDTYLKRYGRAGCIILIGAASVLAAVSAWKLCFISLLWPVYLSIGVSLITWVQRPLSYKITETVVTLSLLTHVWIIPCTYFILKAKS